MLGIEFPLVAFTHCRDVVVEVSKAGGMGVLGAAGLRPDQLETELAWIDAHIEGKPYGVDLIVPTSFASKGQDVDQATQVAQVPEAHKAFVHSLMASHGIDTSDLTDDRLTSGTRLGDNMQDSGANALLDVAFAHPIGLIANALGTPPAYMLERGKQAGVAVAALVGAREHAIKQVEAGVDILVVAGGEAGGHCGEVSTLVLVPEVAEAIRPYGNTPILAAGGIVTGRQMAACMAMGADGAWTGSVWLTTTEAETSPVVKEKDALCLVAPDRALQSPNRQVLASAALRLDRRLGVGRRPRAAAHAAAVHRHRTGHGQDHQAGRRRPRRGPTAGQLLRRPGRGPDERQRIGPHRGLRIHAGFPQRQRAVERLSRRLTRERALLTAELSAELSRAPADQYAEIHKAPVAPAAAPDRRAVRPAPTQT